MEHQQINPSLFDLSLTENVKTQLKGAAIWAGVAAILSLVTAVLSIVLQFTGSNTAAKYQQVEGFSDTAMKAQTGVNIFSAVISLAVTGLFFYFLNRFARLTKTGINRNDEEMVTNGLGSLSAYFIALGIVFIIILAAALLGLVAAAFFAATRV